MPIDVSKTALQQLMAQSLREKPSGYEELATNDPSLPSGSMLPTPYASGVDDQSPEAPAKKGASWWAHAMNLGGAGYNAYAQDKIRKYNETEGGKSYIGWDQETYKPEDGLGGILKNLDNIDVAKFPHGPALGNAPSQGRIYGQSLGTAALMSLAGHFLPKKIGNVALSMNGAASGAFGGLRHHVANSLQKNIDAKRDKYEVFIPYDKPK